MIYKREYAVFFSSGQQTTGWRRLFWFEVHVGQISEEDIQAVIRYLEIHDPKNANRGYAIQFIESMEGFGSEIARSSESLAETLKKSLDKKKPQG